MATIFPRYNKDGSVTWRVQIRRKGLKSFITGFTKKKDAEKFIEENEIKYVMDSQNFQYDHLRSKREREFKRKEKS